MTLKTALEGFSVKKYYELSGYQYRVLDCNNRQHSHLRFDELNPSMKHGILMIIDTLYRTQKMVYDYDITVIHYHLRKSGLIVKHFYQHCDVPASFYINLSLSTDKIKRLMSIRMEIARILIRLFQYMNTIAS